MPLPKHEQKHTYTVELPSGTKVKIRPWIVREEQEYMYATEGLKEPSEYTPHIEQLIVKCIEDNTKVENLSEVDFLALAVELRKVSIGETHEIVFTCPHCKTINDEVYIDLNLDIESAAMKSEAIEVGKNEFTFKDVSRKNLAKLVAMDSSSKRELYYLIYSLVAVATEEQTYTKFSEKETIEFFETMPPGEFKKLSKEFAMILPTFAIRKVIPCEKCKKETVVFVDKVTDFFV